MSRRENQLKCLEALKEIDKVFTENNIWYSLSYGSALGAYREHGFIEWDGDIDILVKRPDQEKATTLLKSGLTDQFRLISHTEDSLNGFDEIDIIGVSADDMHIDIYGVIAGPDDIKMAYRFLKQCRLSHRIIECKTLEFDRLTKKWKIIPVLIIRAVEKLIPNDVLRKHMEKTFDRYDFENAKYYFPYSNDGKIGEIMEPELLFNTRRITFEDTELPVPSDTEEYLRRIYGDNFMTPIKY